MKKKYIVDILGLNLSTTRLLSLHRGKYEFLSKTLHWIILVGQCGYKLNLITISTYTFLLPLNTSRFTGGKETMVISFI